LRLPDKTHTTFILSKFVLLNDAVMAQQFVDLNCDKEAIKKLLARNDDTEGERKEVIVTTKKMFEVVDKLARAADKTQAQILELTKTLIETQHVMVKNSERQLEVMMAILAGGRGGAVGPPPSPPLLITHAPPRLTLEAPASTDKRNNEDMEGDDEPEGARKRVKNSSSTRRRRPQPPRPLPPKNEPKRTQEEIQIALIAFKQSDNEYKSGHRKTPFLVLCAEDMVQREFPDPSVQEEMRDAFSKSAAESVARTMGFTMDGVLGPLSEGGLAWDLVQAYEAKNGLVNQDNTEADMYYADFAHGELKKDLSGDFFSRYPLFGKIVHVDPDSDNMELLTKIDRDTNEEILRYTEEYYVICYLLAYMMQFCADYRKRTYLVDYRTSLQFFRTCTQVETLLQFTKQCPYTHPQPTLEMYRLGRNLDNAHGENMVLLIARLCLYIRYVCVLEEHDMIKKKPPKSRPVQSRILSARRALSNQPPGGPPHPTDGARQHPDVGAEAEEDSEGDDDDPHAEYLTRPPRFFSRNGTPVDSDGDDDVD
jgi:hypothetical protein